MKQERSIDIKKSIIFAVVIVLSWQLGVYSGIGALLGGAIGGILLYFLFKTMDKIQKKSGNLRGFK